MPLYRIHSHPHTFSGDDKTELSQRITEFYTRRGMPAFYVVVLFIDVAEDSFFVGGKARKDFVRIVVQHFARTLAKEHWPPMMEGLEAIWAPYIKGRGLDWEVHVEQPERELWRLQGLVPPPANSETELQWRSENRPIPY